MAFVAAGTSSNWFDLLDDLITFVNSNGWTTLANTKEAVSAAVAAGGTGYTVSDQLLLVGGNGVDVVAVFNVDAESSGVVTAVSLVTAGSYHYEPSNPAATTGGTGGDDCTLTVTYQPLTDVTGDKRVTIRGDGSGSDEIFCSIRAFDNGGGAFLWSLFGHVGFQAQVDLFLQPNTSPDNAFVPLNNSGITYWFFATANRIICVFRIGSTYLNMHLGFMNRFGTAATYPYPLLVMGCSSLSTLIFSDSTAGMGGLTDPINSSSTSTVAGPAFVIDPGGTWKTVRNSGGASGFRPKNDDLVVWPLGRLATGTFTMSDLFNATTGSPTATVGQTPDSGASTGFRFPLHPSIVQERSPVPQLLGEIDNVKWAGTLSEGAGQAVSEDVYNINGSDYLLFQNVNRTDHWAAILIKRE